jgi:hypothetical protein
MLIYYFSIMSDDNEPKIASSRTRSPAYPTTNLEEALAKAKIIWDKDGQNETSLKAMAAHWGYNEKSSSTAQLAAALRKFGLLDDVPGKVGKLKLSASVIRIFSDGDPESASKAALLKKAALSPKIYSDLWVKYEGSPPSDVNIKTHLIADLNFNKDIVDKLIRDFRNTITFAKLSNADKISVVAPQVEALEESKKPLFQQKHVTDNIKAATAPGTLLGDFINPPPMAVLREFNFPLPTGVATLKIPFPLTEDDFDNLLSTLNSFKDGLVKRSEPILIEHSDDWKEKANVLASIGAEFNLANFDFSFDVEDAREIAVKNGLDLRLDLNRSLALFRKRSKKDAKI